MRFELPVPPSTNNLHFTTARLGARRATTKEYKNWTAVAKWSLAAQARKAGYQKLPEKTPFSVYITANVDYRRDIDNIAKPTLDALRKAEVIPDDRYCNRLDIHRVRKERRPAKGRILVAVYEYPDE